MCLYFLLLLCVTLLQRKTYEFTKKNKIPDHLDTLIGSKAIFKGILTSNESICIEDTVKGKVECRGSIVVGLEGKVKADIIAENALIGGQVNDNIKIRNKLKIT